MSGSLCRKTLLVTALCALAAIAADADGRWRGEIRLTVPSLQARSFTMELKTDASGRVSGTMADENGNDKVEIHRNEATRTGMWRRRQCAARESALPVRMSHKGPFMQRHFVHLKRPDNGKYR